MIDEIHALTQHVWVCAYDPTPDSPQPAVGIVVVGDQTLLIDAGNGLRHARRVRSALRMLNAPPVRYIIYTHHHSDHISGAQQWPDALIVAHEKCRFLLHDRCLNGAAGWAGDSAGVFSHAMLPQVTFSDQLFLFLGDMPVNMTHVGGQHAADSILVLVDGVLFIGDCYYPPADSDVPDAAMLAALMQYPAVHYVEGHYQPMTRADFAQRFDLDASS